MFLKKSNRGFTLVELLLVIAIVGVLAAIAVPVYTNYMLRARRADAKTVLEQVRAAQEMWRAERGSYAINDGNGTAVAKLVNTMGVPPSPVFDYNWSFSVGPTATTFTAQAVPFTARQLSDGNLTIDHNGQKLPTAKWAK